MTKKEIIDHAMSWEGMMSEWDLDLIYDQCQQYIQEGGCAIEIGGWKGTSTYVIGSVCKEKNAVLYEIDTFRGVEDPNSRKNVMGNLGGYYEAFTNPSFYWIMREHIKGLPVAMIKGSSVQAVDFLPDRMFDYVFLDGNHESPVFDHDMKSCIQKLRVGGLLTGHDHGNPDTQVAEVVARILKDDWKLDVRPVVGDPKYLLTIWSHIIKEEDYAI